jgi:hypothetical protein
MSGRVPQESREKRSLDRRQIGVEMVLGTFSFLGGQIIRITTLTVRLSVALKEFANGQVGEAGPY